MAGRVALAYSGRIARSAAGARFRCCRLFGEPRVLGRHDPDFSGSEYSTLKSPPCLGLAETMRSSRSSHIWDMDLDYGELYRQWSDDDHGDKEEWYPDYDDEDEVAVPAASDGLDVREAIGTQTEVALSLAKQLLADSNSKATNLVFSPVSMHVVLSLMAAGSAGHSRSELLSFLKSPSQEHLNSLASYLLANVFSDGSPAGGPKLSFANGLWLDRFLSLKQPFKQVLDTSYKAAANLADFQAKASEVIREVNAWAEKETGGLIKEALPAGSVDVRTSLLFMNALYFKGAWRNKFDPSETADAEFHLLDGTSVQVPFMTSKRKRAVGTFDGFKVLKLPYRRGGDERDFSMYLFLPDTKDGLPSLAERFCSDPCFFQRLLPLSEAVVGEFKIPRFNISFGFDAKELMVKLGVVSPFIDDGSRRGVAEMVEEPPEAPHLYVASMFQKSLIEVNEGGTEASAASGFTGGYKCLEKTDFVADHPFMFLIRENKTRAILFMGQVLNPSIV